MVVSFHCKYAIRNGTAFFRSNFLYSKGGDPVKHLLCIILALVLVFSAFPVTAYADELTGENRKALEALLIESVTENTPVEIGQFAVTVEDLQKIYRRLLNSGRLPWNADTNFEYATDATGCITMFRPRHSEGSQFDERMYEEKMAELIAETCLEGMEPWQIVLNVHEYIITRCNYEYGTANNSYSALIEGKTACYGYSRLFLEVMDRVGIDCKIVIAEGSGDGIGHGWNVVLLDGDWYHVDLTWDDPIGCPRYGFVRHNHFLKSDRQFQREGDGHNFPWEVDVVCDNEKYSTAPAWENAESPMVFLDAQTMLLRRNTAETLQIYAVDCQTMEESLLYEEEIPITTLSTGTFLCGSYGLSLYEGRIYFTNSREILSILPDGTDRQVEYAHDSAQDSYIISNDVQNGTLFYSLADATGKYADRELTLSVDPSHIHNYTSQAISPTCTERGYSLWTCSCGIQYTTDYIDAGHVFVEEVVNKEGVEFLRISCENCDYATEEEHITAPTESTEETASSEDAGTVNSIPISGSLKWVLIGIGGFALVFIITLIRRGKKRR